MDSAGNVHIALTDNHEIYYTKLDNNGNTVVNDTRLTSDSAYSSWPSLGVDSAANIHIAWYDYRDGNYEIYYTKGRAVCDGSDGDTDCDGLLDDWEINGYDHDGDGIIDVDLPGMGADPDHKDIFVEIDWMKADDHNHKPKRRAIRKIIRAFDKAPVNNPDGTTGITLHVDTGDLGGGEKIIHVDDLDPVWKQFDAIKTVNFAPGREPIFHYCVFAHNYNGKRSSGLSRGIPASDFIVSLGSWLDWRGKPVGTVREQAGTFMHELGHNLDLKHGGTDNVNYKPNHLSVMNYFFQTKGLYKKRGVRRWGLFDYSRFNIPVLDENCLDETVGLNGSPEVDSYGTRYWWGGSVWDVPLANEPIDWNRDDDDTEPCAEADVNYCSTCDPPTGEGLSKLAATNEEWPRLVFDGGLIGTGVEQLEIKREALPMDFIMDELTLEEDRLINQY